jgi:nicotinamidase-related amidase
MVPNSFMTSLSPLHLAVLVIDVQVGLFCTDPPPFDADEVICRINSVTAKARAARVPVIFVQNDGPPAGNWLVPHTQDWQLHPDLVRDPGELVIRKTAGDAFYGTVLEKALRAREIQSLILTGYATDFCIDSTLRNAVSKEFEIFIVSDAHTTNDTPALSASLIRNHFNWVWSDIISPRGIQLISASDLVFG